MRKVAQVLEQSIKEESQELDKVAGWIRASCEQLCSTKCSNLHAIDYFGRVALRAGLVVVGRVCLPFLIAFQIWSFELPSPLHELEGHTGCVRCSAFSLDGMLLATGDDNGEIRVGVPTAIASLL